MAVPSQPSVPEVYSAREVARAAGVPTAIVLALAEAGAVDRLPAAGRFFSTAQALELARVATAGAAPPVTVGSNTLFGPLESRPRAWRGPLAVSSTLHLGALASMVLATTLGLGSTSAATLDDSIDRNRLRLVFLTVPGPGGGGGGGGLRQRVKPPRAEREGKRALDSPIPVRELPTPPAPVEKPKDPDPPKVEPEPLPPVQAPVVASPSDETNRPGVIEDTQARHDSRGPGTGGGVGTGTGTGLGEGDGTGIGEGSGGGTGGGPYRPGSGITPPSLLREVKPNYTEEARRRGVEGDVVMEIVVRSDGSVGDVKILQGLGHGLDQRAADAVAQWRFSPARRRGAAVDVVVEVAMEFKLR